MTEKIMKELFEVVQAANWYKKQGDYQEYLDRALVAATSLCSYMPDPIAAELLTKIAKGGPSYPHECRVIALKGLARKSN